MLLKLISCLLLCLGVATARAGYAVPQFYAQDSAVIVDTDKGLPALVRPHYRLLPAYPAYHIIPATLPPPSSSSTASMTTPVYADEFPNDLLEIAQEKLGLKSLDEIPSISELGELLGTSSGAETVKYIRQLTSTEQGIALMKAYIESSDYTDNNANSDDDNNADDADGSDDDKLPELPAELSDNSAADGDDDDEEGNAAADEEEQTANDGIDDEDELAVKAAAALRPRLRTTTAAAAAITTTPTPKPGFLARMYSYLNVYNMWPSARESQPPHPRVVAAATQTPPPVDFIKHMSVDFKRPLLVRQPLPYHYPIPLRPLQANATPPTVVAPSTPPPSPPPPPTVAHLNTPKLLLSPQMQNLIKAATNITAKQLETFLQQKPKLAELATRVSGLPFAYERGSQMEAQLMAAVQKAIAQDEDLRKLLNSTETLK